VGESWWKGKRICHPFYSGHRARSFTITQGSTTTTITVNRLQTRPWCNPEARTDPCRRPHELQRDRPGSVTCTSAVAGSTAGDDAVCGWENHSLSGPSSGPAIQNGSKVTGHALRRYVHYRNSSIPRRRYYDLAPSVPIDTLNPGNDTPRGSGDLHRSGRHYLHFQPVIRIGRLTPA